MKSAVFFAVNAVYCALISVCLPMCLASSFGISFSTAVLVIASVIFSLLLGCTALFLNRKKYIISAAAVFIVGLSVVLLNLEAFLNSLEYAVNKVLGVYSDYMSVPSGVRLSDSPETSDNATFVLIILALIICALSSLTLFRLKRNVIIYVTVFILLLPCFVLVNTMPDIFPAAAVLSVVFSLYMTAYTRKHSKSAGSLITAATAVVLAGIIFAITVICPKESFARFEWQDALLNGINDLPSAMYSAEGDDGDDGKAQELLKESSGSIDEAKDLSSLGEFELTGTEAMQIKAYKSGRVYLKGVSYANYSDNTWSVLTEEQAEYYPDGFDAFTMRNCTADTEKISVSTVNSESVIYTTYYTDESEGTPVADVFVKNGSGRTEYTLSYKQGSDSDSLESGSDEYTDFVYDNYLELPESTKDEINKLIVTMIPRYGFDDSLSASENAESVKQCVSECAEYSAVPDTLPDGEDFAAWFLGEADRGYCVHFATTAAVMLRALGIPSRYVVGYAAEAKANEWVTVTSDDAHAWVEYYDKEKGWVMLDPTPVASSSASSASVTDRDEPTTADIQAETVPETTDIKEQTASSSYTQSKSAEGGSGSSGSGIPIFTIIAAAVVLIAALIVIRMKIRDTVRARRFSKGSAKKRVLYIYGYIKKLAANKYIPDNIQKIAEEAAYSSHRITDEQAETMQQYAEDLRKNLYDDAGILKKLYFRLILAV